MSQPKKDGNAGLWAAITALALMFAIALPVVGADINNRMNKLRDHGVVTAALITGKHYSEQRETAVQAGGGKAVSRNTINETFDLSIDRIASSTFYDVANGGTVRQSNDPVLYSYTMNVGPAVFEQFNEGDTILVTFLPDSATFDKDSIQLFETVRSQSKANFAIWFYITSALLLIIGIWAGFKTYRANK